MHAIFYFSYTSFIHSLQSTTLYHPQQSTILYSLMHIQSILNPIEFLLQGVQLMYIVRCYRNESIFRSPCLELVHHLGDPTYIPQCLQWQISHRRFPLKLQVPCSGWMMNLIDVSLLYDVHHQVHERRIDDPNRIRPSAPADPAPI